MMAMKQTLYSVIKWRGLIPPEAAVWANLRLDRVEKELGLDYITPDIEYIRQKLQEEATEKEAYSINTSCSVLKECLTKLRIIGIVSARHILNCLLRSNQCKPQNKASNEHKEKANEVKITHES